MNLSRDPRMDAHGARIKKKGFFGGIKISGNKTPKKKSGMFGGFKISGNKTPEKKSGMLGGFKIGGNNTAKKKVGMFGLVKEKKTKKNMDLSRLEIQIKEES